MNRKTEFKLFNIAQYRDEGEYLGKMHENGWRFTGVTFPGFYHFEECEPEKVTYQLDYNPEKRRNKGEYVKLFEDCGWEYILDFVGFSYFRKAGSQMDNDEEIFSDDESRLDMMKRVYKGRLLPLISIFFLCIIPQLISNVEGYGNGSSVQTGLAICFSIMFYIYLCMFASFGISYLKYEKQVRGNIGEYRRKMIIFIAVIVGLAGFCAAYLIHSHTRKSDYMLKENMDCYELEMTYFNDEIFREYDLKKGDVIRVEYVHDGGRIKLLMGINGEPYIYTGELEQSCSFTVTVMKDGLYEVDCTGKKAKGNVKISIEKQEK